MWASSRSQCWAGEPGILQSMGSQRFGHDWVTDLNWRPLGLAIRNLSHSSLHSLQSTLVLPVVDHYHTEHTYPFYFHHIMLLYYLPNRTLKDELPRSVGAQYVTAEQWRNNPIKNEEMEPKQKQHPVVDVTCDKIKVQFCKEKYCIGTWNVRSKNQNKLEVVKQKIARVKVDVLGISEPKWTGMGEFNSDDHYIYYCGQESLRRNGVAIIVNKRAQDAVLRCSLKNNRIIYVHFQGKPSNITVI